MLMNARDKETGAPMSDRELIDEIMTLVVAGHETTASGAQLDLVSDLAAPASRGAAARRNRCRGRMNGAEPRADGSARPTPSR